MDFIGYEKMNGIINDFVSQFDAEAGIGTDFYCDINSNYISYALVTIEKDTADFMESVIRLNPEVDADPFLWSLLHEVGHIMTEDEFDEEDYDDYEESIEVIKRNGNNLDYYNLPMETAATGWAVDYANTHVAELSEFWKILQPAIIDFFMQNEVEM